MENNEVSDSKLEKFRGTNSSKTKQNFVYFQGGCEPYLDKLCVYAESK